MDIKQETKNDDFKCDPETAQLSLKLKYERFTGDINSKTENDSILCLKAHHKFIVAAMKSGIVYILNRSDGNVKKQYTPHQHAVSDISIDKWGRHIATCCADGTVVILKIVSNTYKSTQHKFKNQQLLSIELHPNYDTKSMFVTGGAQQELILKTVGFFNTKKTLDCNNGSIYCIAWKGELIAWVNDTKVNLYDIVNYKNIAQIKDSGGSECCLCWEDSNTLLIASTHCVTIVEINQMKKVSVTRKITTEFCVCSIAPYEKYLILLAVDESKTPQIRIVLRNGSDVATHNLDINKYDNNRVSDYNIECVVKSANNKQWTCYVTSPKDIIICKQWTFMDDIILLYSNGKCEEAWLKAMQHENELNKSEINLEMLGQKMLNYILSNEEHKFGKLCEQICDKNKRLWEKWINILSEKKKLNLIIPFIPRNEIHLSPNLQWKVINEINTHKEEYDECFIDSWREMENSSKAKENEVNERKEQNDDNVNDKKQNDNEQKMVVGEEEKKEIDDLLSDSWSCSICTFENNGKDEVCVICAQGVKYADKWSCVSCTWVNSKTNNVCDMCNVGTLTQSSVENIPHQITTTVIPNELETKVEECITTKISENTDYQTSSDKKNDEQQDEQKQNENITQEDKTSSDDAESSSDNKQSEEYETDDDDDDSDDETASTATDDTDEDSDSSDEDDSDSDSDSD
eukprot:243871_1